VAREQFHKEDPMIKPTGIAKLQTDHVLGIELWRFTMASNEHLNIPISRQPQQTPAAAEQSFPARFIDCMNAYRQGAALKAAIELDLFTVLSEGGQTAESLALCLQPVASESSVIT
jgi:hypothetical protein